MIACFWMPVHNGRIQGLILSEEGKTEPVSVMAIPEESDRTGQGTQTDDSGHFLLTVLEKSLHSVLAFVTKKGAIRYSEHTMLATDQKEQPTTLTTVAGLPFAAVASP